MKWSKTYHLEKLAWGLVWFSLPFSLKFNGLSLMILGVLILINFFRNPFLPAKHQFLLMLPFIAYFAMLIIAGFSNVNREIFFFGLEKKYSFIFIPLMYLLTANSFQEIRKYTVKGFFIGLLVSGLHMLLYSFIGFVQSGDFSTFTYHDFTQPYGIGAIYYSYFLAISIFLLLDISSITISDKWRISLLAIFTAFLLLSASKLFILITLPLALWYYWIQKIKHLKSKYLILAGIVILILIGIQPMKIRFKELSLKNLEIVQQDKFTYDTPFNGLSIRLVQWRFGIEILNEQNAWLIGCGIGDTQDLLNQKYKQTGVYTGNPDLDDTGYLNYNFHNQYIETLAGTGIIGLVILVLIFIVIFEKQKKVHYWPGMVYILTLLFFITESVLERQVGIVMFCLIFSSPITKIGPVKSLDFTIYQKEKN